MAALSCRMYINTEAFTNNAARLNGLGYVYVRGVVFSEPCCSSTQCFVMSCMSNPLLHYTDFIKFTKIKARLALNIPQNSVLNLHEIGLPYIIAI